MEQQHKIGKPHRHREDSLTGKEHSARFTRGYRSFRMWLFVKGRQQCFNCQKLGHHARTCRSEIHTCRYCAVRHHSHQCKDNKQLTLKCANYEQEHATTSRLCPKRIEVEKKAKNAPASQRTTQKQDSRKPSTIPLFKRMGHIDRTGSGKTARFMQTINSHNHTHNHQANN